MDHRKMAVAVDITDYSEIAAEVKEVAVKESIDLSRTIETPDNTYVCLYWDWIDWDMPEVESLMKKLKGIRHAVISIDQEESVFKDISVSDKNGCDEEFYNILSLEQNICFWNEGEVLSHRRDYVPISRKRLIALLQSYIMNDQNENHFETATMYRSLNNAGFADYEIEELGFGYCIPEEKEDAVEAFEFGDFYPEETE